MLFVLRSYFSFGRSTSKFACHVSSLSYSFFATSLKRSAPYIHIYAYLVWSLFALMYMTSLINVQCSTDSTGFVCQVRIVPFSSPIQCLVRFLKKNETFVLRGLDIYVYVQISGQLGKSWRHSGHNWLLYRSSRVLHVNSVDPVDSKGDRVTAPGNKKNIQIL